MIFGNPPKSGPKLFKRYKTTELQQDYLWESSCHFKKQSVAIKYGNWRTANYNGSTAYLLVSRKYLPHVRK